MSKKSYKKKTSKKRVYKKSAKKPANLTIVNLGLGFPKKLMMTLKYSNTVTINSLAGSVGATNFACNGLWDPFLTGAGHQPMYFDQIMSLYDHYHVVGAKATIRLIPTISTIYPAAIGCYLNDDTTRSVVTLDDHLEQSVVKHKYVNLNSTPQDLTFTMKWSAKKNYGSSIMANTYLRGDAFSNPLETQVFTVFGACVGPDSQSWYCLINLEYIAVFNELKDIPGS